MRFCKYCGVQISDTDEVCPSCRRDLRPPATIQSSSRSRASSGTAAGIKQQALNIYRRHKKALIAAALLAAVIILLVSMNAGKCRSGGCRNKTVSGSNYCYSHKCAIAFCNSKRLSYSNYCFSHYSLYDDDAVQSGSYVPSYQLKISNVELSSNSSYTIAEGTFTNNSDETVSFVKIKGSFKTTSGTVVDTDWTYAVGSEGLAPGESCKWRMSVSKDRSIADCDVTILDYDY